MTTPLWTGSEWSFDTIQRTYEAIENIGCKELKATIYPNQFEIVSAEQMLDAITSVGMPVMYKHWSFGKRFLGQWEEYKLAGGNIPYEMVINSNPCVNYLVEDNSMTLQALVMAHAAIGHNTFFKNNYLFKQWTDADSIIDYLVFARDFIAETEQKEGAQRVEQFLDSCHALMEYGVNRYKHPAKLSVDKEKHRLRERDDYLQTQVDEFYKILPTKRSSKQENKEVFPAQPEENLLYFFEKHAPNLKRWQREILRIVRKISQYFYPQRLTKIANEGTACFFHVHIMNILRERELSTDGAHLEFLDSHVGVVRQLSFNHPYYSGINPYRIGLEIFQDIERICKNPDDEDRFWFPDITGEDWLSVIHDTIANFRDESLLRQYLGPKVIRKMRLFHVFDDRTADHYLVKNIHNVDGFNNVRNALADEHEAEFYQPMIEVSKVDPDTRTLFLQYTPNRKRELADITDTLKHVQAIWQLPVKLVTSKGLLIKAL